MSEAPPDPWIGQRLGGRYEIKGFLGEGGWARVYRGFDTSLGRDVALKVPHAHIVENEKDAEAFRREIRKLVAVEHPSVVRVHDAVAAPDGRPVAVLEFMRGGSLDARLDAAPGKTQPLDEVLSWLTPVADALDHLHGVVGLVHADIKPQNVLFDGSSRPRLSDFGIVVSLDPGKSSRLLRTASTGGTPLYMAPELLLDGQKPSARSDQYALAVTAYQALAGRLPYAVPDTDDAILFIAQWGRALERGAPLSLHDASPEVTEAASDVVMRALARTPDARYPSCLALVDALRAAIVPVPVPSPVAVRRTPFRARALRSPQRPANPVIRRALFAMVSVVALAGGAILLSGGEKKSKTSESARSQASVPVPVPAPVPVRVPVPIPGPELAAIPRASSTVARSLVVEEPAEGALLATAEVRVTGQVVGETGDVLTVQGKSVPVSDGRFSTTVTISPDDLREIVVTYGPPEDPAQRSTHRRLDVDTTRPVVVVSVPTGGWGTYPATTAEATVTGRATDRHLKAVWIDGVEVSTLPDGSFTSTIPLTRETTDVSIVAEDTVGLRSEIVHVTLNRENSPPASAPVVPGRPAWADDLEVATTAALSDDMPAASAAWDRAVAKGAAASDATPALTARIARWRAPPELFVSEPQEGVRVAAKSVRVRGDLRSGRSTDEVLVNGVVARAGVGVFEVTVTLAQEGVNHITVSVRDGGVVRGVTVELVVTLVSPSGRAPGWSAPVWRGPLLEPAVAAFLDGWAEAVGATLDDATGYPKRIRRTRDGGEMILISAGTFWMGGDAPSDAARAKSMASGLEQAWPRHEVTLSRAYYLDEHEVTNQQFEAFANESGYQTESELSGMEGYNEGGPSSRGGGGYSWRRPWPDATIAQYIKDRTRHPVVKMSWTDASRFSSWAGVTLPTEAQFERALRCGVDRARYPWGDNPLPDAVIENLQDRSFRVKNHPAGGTPGPASDFDAYDDGFPLTAPVKSFRPNAWGFYDLGGNVKEWCSDAYGPYSAGPVTDPFGPAASGKHVLRGGDWWSLPGESWSDPQASSRNGMDGTAWSHGVGFRCAKTLP